MFLTENRQHSTLQAQKRPALTNYDSSIWNEYGTFCCTFFVLIIYNVIKKKLYDARIAKHIVDIGTSNDSQSITCKCNTTCKDELLFFLLFSIPLLKCCRH